MLTTIGVLGILLLFSAIKILTQREEIAGLTKRWEEWDQYKQVLGARLVKDDEALREALAKNDMLSDDLRGYRRVIDHLRTARILSEMEIAQIMTGENSDE